MATLVKQSSLNELVPQCGDLLSRKEVAREVQFVAFRRGACNGHSEDQRAMGNQKGDQAGPSSVKF